ncbi:MAG: hypothetical protein HQ575_07415 [Candidatus Omnitrophica bacterium]|nr:hypothetical protein [Candidatus Omnitrophota bacterium]
MIIYEEVLRTFHKEKVKYVIVGGIAVNLLGSLRTTADLDILVEMSDENLRKIVTILKGQGYRVKQPVDPMEIANSDTRRDWIEDKNMKAFNFYKKDDLKEVDIIIESPVTFKEAEGTRILVKTGDLKLPVISISNLIKMKQGTGRGVDMLDIKQLREIEILRRDK